MKREYRDVRFAIDIIKGVSKIKSSKHLLKRIFSVLNMSSDFPYENVPKTRIPPQEQPTQLGHESQMRPKLKFQDPWIPLIPVGFSAKEVVEFGARFYTQMEVW
jgi:hypothetical protein